MRAQSALQLAYRLDSNGRNALVYEASVTRSFRQVCPRERERERESASERERERPAVMVVVVGVEVDQLGGQEVEIERRGGRVCCMLIARAAGVQHANLQRSDVSHTLTLPPFLDPPSDLLVQGRTETVRALSVESQAFVDAMLDPEQVVPPAGKLERKGRVGRESGGRGGRQEGWGRARGSRWRRGRGRG